MSAVFAFTVFCRSVNPVTAPVYVLALAMEEHVYRALE